jgi:hypothetical protein
MEYFIVIMVFMIGYSCGESSARTRFRMEQEEKEKGNK